MEHNNDATVSEVERLGQTTTLTTVSTSGGAQTRDFLAEDETLPWYVQ